MKRLAVGDGYTILLGLVLALTIFSFWETDSAEQARSLFAGAVAVAVLGGIVYTWIGLALAALRFRR